MIVFEHVVDGYQMLWRAPTCRIFPGSSFLFADELMHKTFELASQNILHSHFIHFHVNKLWLDKLEQKNAG